MAAVSSFYSASDFLGLGARRRTEGITDVPACGTAVFRMVPYVYLHFWVRFTVWY